MRGGVIVLHWGERTDLALRHNDSITCQKWRKGLQLWFIKRCFLGWRFLVERTYTSYILIRTLTGHDLNTSGQVFLYFVFAPLIIKTEPLCLWMFPSQEATLVYPRLRGRTITAFLWFNKMCFLLSSKIRTTKREILKNCSFQKKKRDQVVLTRSFSIFSFLHAQPSLILGH